MDPGQKGGCRMSTVAEDYVKVIYSHTEWQPEPITTSGLAARLGVAPSTVTETVKKLAAAGLVTHVRYGAVTLTAKGTELALAMVRRHRLIETWLVSQFAYTWDEVHDEAEVLEHALSDRLLDAIDDLLGNPTRDPHGDPIPARDGTVVRPEGVLVGEVGAGERVRVVRISDSDPQLLRHLETEGISLDTGLVVVGRAPFGGSFVVALGESGEERDLGQQALESIWVRVDTSVA